MTAGPTVLFGVGATKSGTTWLHGYLHQHPDCAFSSLKELHYFNTVTEADRRRKVLGTTRALADLRARRDGADDRHRHRLGQRISDLHRWLAVLEAPRPEGDNAAYMHYLTEVSGQSKLVGDITPAYALLAVEALREMANIAPDVRFVYLMRDPVSRLWSHVRMMAKRNCTDGRIDAYALDLFDAVIAGSNDSIAHSVRVRGDYVGAVQRLRAAVAPERLFCGLMEDVITTNGVTVLCDFLGIRHYSGQVDQKIHVGLDVELDSRRVIEARQVLQPQYDFANQNFAPLPQAWQEQLQGIPA